MIKTFWLGIIAAWLMSAGLRAQQTGVAVAAPPPLASHYVNDELPRWVRFGGEFRSRLEAFSGEGYRHNSTDGFLLTRLRINMTLQPAPFVKLFVQGQDARAPWKNRQAPPFQSSMHLRQAYAEFGNTVEGRVALRVGRQELSFGEERMIGPSSWLNTPRYFEAARLTLRHGRYRLDAFASSVVVVQDGAYSKSDPPNNLHGLYGGVNNVIPGSTIEPYLLWRLQRNLPTESGTRGNLDFKAGGVRWVGNVPRMFDYNLETVLERGGLGTDDVAAWGAHLVIGRTFAQSRYKPRVFGEYNYASGDENPVDARRGTFDPIYPTGHDRFGLADQFGWKNIHHLRFAVEVAAAPRLVLKSSYHNFWLASATDGLFAPSGTLITRLPSGEGGRRVGQEFDVQAAWTIRPDTVVAVGYADLIPGGFLKTATPGANFRYPFVQMTYTF
jgi:hypothetical protein